MELSATSEVRRPWWTLTLLVFLLIMSLMDRIILSLLVQPLRDTFQISDVQFGLLFGTSFAILYGLLGFPAATSEDHTSELPSLMRIPSAVFCLHTHPPPSPPPPPPPPTPPPTPPHS